MKTRPVLTAHREAHAARLAWILSFLATVALFALLSIAHTAQAQSLPAASVGSLVPLAFEEEEEGEEEWGESEWEEAEQEWCEEEGEEGEEEWCTEEEEEAEDEASECVIVEATGRVVARPSRRRLDLAIRYRAERPAAVRIRWSLRGRKGRLGLGTERARFSRAGTYRHRETRLGRKRMAKALASREFRVAVRAVNTPSYCKSEFDLRLSSRHGPRARPYWTEPGRSF